MQTGNFSLTVRLMSDCYVGLDIEKEVKYEIKAAKKDKIDANSHDDH